MTAELALSTRGWKPPTLEARARGMRRGLGRFAREIVEKLDATAKAASLDPIDVAYDVLRGLRVADAHLAASHEVDAVVSTETARGRVVLLPQRYASVVALVPSADRITAALSVIAPALLGGSPVVVPEAFEGSLLALLLDALQAELPAGSIARGEGTDGSLVTGVVSPDEGIVWAASARERGQSYRVHEDTGGVAIVLDASRARRAARLIRWSSERANGRGLMRVRRLIVLADVESKIRSALEAVEGAPRLSASKIEGEPATESARPALTVEVAKDEAEAIAIAGRCPERSFACAFSRHFDRALEALGALHHPRGAVGSTEPPVALGGIEFPRSDALPGLPFGEPRVIVDGRPTTPLLSLPYTARTRSVAEHHLVWRGDGPIVARVRAGALGLYESLRRRIELS